MRGRTIDAIVHFKFTFSVISANGRFDAASTTTRSDQSHSRIQRSAA
jgi:hypothetical protein